MEDQDVNTLCPCCKIARGVETVLTLVVEVTTVSQLHRMSKPSPVLSVMQDCRGVETVLTLVVEVTTVSQLHRAGCQSLVPC